LEKPLELAIEKDNPDDAPKHHSQLAQPPSNASAHARESHSPGHLSPAEKKR
jgi:hypothetical protein